MNKTTNHSKKIFIIPLILGIIILILGITMIIFGVNNYLDAKKEYKAELAQYELDYDKWYDEWWNDHTATLNDQPKHPGFEPSFSGIGVVGIVLTVFSIPCILGGLTAFFAKKAYNQAQDYAESQNSDSNTTILDLFVGKEKTYTCTYCGTTIKQNQTKCDSCGASIKK